MPVLKMQISEMQNFSADTVRWSFPSVGENLATGTYCLIQAFQELKS